MKIKTLISPIVITPLIFLSQFFIWLLTFERLKNTVPGLESVSYHLTASAFLKYMLFFGFLYFFIILGFFSIKNIQKLRVRNAQHSAQCIKLSNIFLIQIAGLLLLLVLISEIINFYIMWDLLKKPTILFSQGLGLANLAYVTLQDESNWFRTFYNFLPIVVGIYTYFLSSLPAERYNLTKKRLKIKLVISFIVSMMLFLRGARQLTIVILLVFVALYAKYKIGFNKRISIKLILSLVILLLFLIVFSEILRFGVLNATRRDIGLFSLENISDVIKYILVAYLGKNVNNAMIIFDSNPTYSMFGTGSRLIYSIIEKIVSPPQFTPSYYLGPHGTVDFTALIWEDWGWGGLIVVSLIGFLIGFSYKLYLITKTSFFWNLLYSIVYPGIFSCIRINYFFLNVFIYPFTILMFSWVIEQSFRKHNKIFQFNKEVL